VYRKLLDMGLHVEPVFKGEGRYGISHFIVTAGDPYCCNPTGSDRP
jgi:hypothetical protein